MAPSPLTKKQLVMSGIATALRSGPLTPPDLMTRLLAEGKFKNYLTNSRFQHILNLMTKRHMLLRADGKVFLEPGFARLSPRDALVVIISNSSDWPVDVLEALS